MRREEQHAEIRAKYGVPTHYGPGLKMPDGSVHFDWCDSTISVGADGRATETHMALGASSHEFVTREWVPQDRGEHEHDGD